MVTISPFSALHPSPEKGDSIPSVPYDVISSESVKKEVKANPSSFLRVTRPDAELSDLSPTDPAVYERARENFQALIHNGDLIRLDKPFFYVYKIFQGGKIYYGLFSSLSVDDYLHNRIRKHELTTYDKEEDRTRHIKALNAHAGPVVLIFRDSEDVLSLLKGEAAHPSSLLVRSNRPDGSVHEIYTISPSLNPALYQKFSAIDGLYIADGHHRAKSAVNVALEQRRNGRPLGEAEWFPGVLFPDNGIDIYAYHRLISDIGGKTPGQFMQVLSDHFKIVPYPSPVSDLTVIPPLHSSDTHHVFHIYCNSCWYECTREKNPLSDRISALDVSVIQSIIFEGMLGITDPRGDARLRYLGGVHPMKALENGVNQGEYILAFGLQPLKVSDVLSISDDGEIMPPKSTWFEPKLLCGLLIHTF